MISYGRRLTFAFRTFFSILVHGRIPDDVAAELVKREAATPAPAMPPAPSGDRAVQLLSILQRDGRLIDFLMEDLTAYADAQIGAAARDVHGGCRQALDRYFTLVPVVDEDEGRPITVEPGADPARIKVMGNALSAGAFILQAASERVMTPHSWLLVHEAQISDLSGNFSQVSEASKQIKRHQDQLLSLLASRSTLSVKQLKTKWANADWYLSAEEALQYGFVDRIET